MRDTVKIDKRGVRLIAHRTLPESSRNTCVIYRRRKQSHGIETDTASSDGIRPSPRRQSPHRRHPETDFLTCPRAVVMEDKDGRERWDLRVPTLDEYVRICKNYGKVGVSRSSSPSFRWNTFGRSSTS